VHNFYAVKFFYTNIHIFTVYVFKIESICYL